MHAHTLEYRQFRWFRVADGLFECLVACAREYCRPSYAKLSRVSTIQCILRAVLHGGCVSWTANGRQRCVVQSLDKIFPTTFISVEFREKNKRRTRFSCTRLVGKKLIQKKRISKMILKNSSPPLINVFLFVEWTVKLSQQNRGARVLITHCR